MIFNDNLYVAIRIWAARMCEFTRLEKSES